MIFGIGTSYAGSFNVENIFILLFIDIDIFVDIDIGRPLHFIMNLYFGCDKKIRSSDYMTHNHPSNQKLNFVPRIYGQLIRSRMMKTGFKRYLTCFLSDQTKNRVLEAEGE